MIENNLDAVLAAYQQLPLPDQRRLRELLLEQAAQDVAVEAGAQVGQGAKSVASPPTTSAANGSAPLPVRFADKEGLRQAMSQLLAALDVKGAPVSPEQLRREMENSGLEPHELSRSLPEARDE